MKYSCTKRLIYRPQWVWFNLIKVAKYDSGTGSLFLSQNILIGMNFLFKDLIRESIYPNTDSAHLYRYIS